MDDVEYGSMAWVERRSHETLPLFAALLPMEYTRQTEKQLRDKLPPPPSVPVSTSEEAAQRISSATSAMRMTIYEFIRSRGREGATSDEIESALNLKHQTVGPRLRELEQSPPKGLGLIHRPGIKRPTRSGCKALIYVAYVALSLP